MTAAIVRPLRLRYLIKNLFIKSPRRFISALVALRQYASLTPRERQVMALVVSGLLNKQVGGELGISELTVKAHRGQVMQKMKANSLADLVRMAAKLRAALQEIDFARRQPLIVCRQAV